jgi:hypothetical protein
MSESAEKVAKIVNAEGGIMLEIKGIRIEDGRVVVRGALMGAWDTDMYLDAEDVKAAIGMAPIADLMKFAMDNIFEVKISKRD